MDSTIMDITLSQEVWAIIAIFLLIYIVKEGRRRNSKQEERENSYQLLFNQLTEQFTAWDDVKKDVQEIKDYIMMHRKTKRIPDSRSEEDEDT